MGVKWARPSLIYIPVESIFLVEAIIDITITITF